MLGEAHSRASNEKACLLMAQVGFCPFHAGSWLLYHRLKVNAGDESSLALLLDHGIIATRKKSVNSEGRVRSDFIFFTFGRFSVADGAFFWPIGCLIIPLLPVCGIYFW
jgi:hypothetical protein